MDIKFFILPFLLSTVLCEPEAESKPDPTADPALLRHPVGHLVSPIPHRSLYGTFGHSVTPAIAHVTPIPVIGHAVTPAYGHIVSPHPSLYPHTHAKCSYEKAPLCSYNTTKPWCLSDYDYPEYEIKAAIALHKSAVLPLYVDVADLSTVNSVARPKSLYDETYLCPSETGYVRPVRAVNADGKWRIIVNNIKLDYEVFTQTARIEECLNYEKSCPLVPHCYDSKCLQKSTYHKFLVYDPCDIHFPFAIETFKLPASCACFIDTYQLKY